MEPTLGIARPDPRLKKGQKPQKPKKIDPALKNKILERDDHTCAFCGFKAQKYQEIHFKDHDHANHDEKNLVTACVFCQQCFDLENVHKMRSGVLLWLPEIEQTTLHHIARAIYVARISQGPIAEDARKALDVLMKRREEVKNRLTTENPYIVATVMRDYLGYGHYQRKDKKLDGVRLFPLDRRIIREADLEFNQFPQILAYWRSKDGPYGGKPPQEWAAIYANILAAA